MKYSPLTREPTNTSTTAGTALAKGDHGALAIALMVSVLSLWHVRVTGHLSLAAFASFLLFVLLCMAYGHVFLAVTAGLVKNKAGVAFQFSNKRISH